MADQPLIACSSTEGESYEMQRSYKLNDPNVVLLATIIYGRTLEILLGDGMASFPISRRCA